MVEKKFKKLQSDVDVEKLWRQLDKKLSKEDALQKFQLFEARLGKVETQGKNEKGAVERLEVSC